MYTREEMLEYCQYLTDSMAYHDEIGFYYWPWLKNENFEPEDCSHCGICTNGARLIAHRFNGCVYGYPIRETDSTKLVGYNCYGHDFAIVDNYLVDWWGWEYSKELQHPVNLICEVESRFYKSKALWVLNKLSDYRVIHCT